ncbi:hypothetical protein [Leadbettera azotonutricia]|uniref:Uncharacterized protein n=1 Tax=Leadbettera azotonutricia (strain ATCC BAA-888 / DSM 13862 / ZAS-9) TaxID=545695 RepID=F5Y8I9_LEAAZ|nr:hypothetical protein [Leadbettera azotonutricia]AEF80404.1 hypothetical protein TREAZ_3330 [Leadbettera azotonutricia ZAS-9]
MNDVEKQGYTSTSVLAKQGVSAIGNLVGGALLLVMQILGGRFRLLGIVMGLAIGGFGVSGLLSKDPEDKKPGMILTAAGILELVFQFGIPILKPIAGTLLGITALGLLAMGIIKGVKFLKGLKSRG